MPSEPEAVGQSHLDGVVLLGARHHAHGVHARLGGVQVDGGVQPPCGEWARNTQVPRG